MRQRSTLPNQTRNTRKFYRKVRVLARKEEKCLLEALIPSGFGCMAVADPLPSAASFPVPELAEKPMRRVKSSGILPPGRTVPAHAA